MGDTSYLKQIHKIVGRSGTVYPYIGYFYRFCNTQHLVLLNQNHLIGEKVVNDIIKNLNWKEKQNSKIISLFFPNFVHIYLSFLVKYSMEW